MFFKTIQETREFFYTSWHKYQKKMPLSPLETQVVTVMAEHPEYNYLFANPEMKTTSYFPELGETNPFMHLGLHLAIREQTSLNRPRGIKELYESLLYKGILPLDAEHIMIEFLAEALWTAQKAQSLPDETAYLEALQAYIDTL